jgi:hypothetical protein
VADLSAEERASLAAYFGSLPVELPVTIEGVYTVALRIGLVLARDLEWTHELSLACMAVVRQRELPADPRSAVLRALPKLPPGALEEAVENWRTELAQDEEAMDELVGGFAQAVAHAAPSSLARAKDALRSLVADPTIRERPAVMAALRPLGLADVRRG